MITFDHVTIRHHEAEQPTLDDVSLTIPEGDLCLVVGSTGSGKSTLLGAINALVPHFSGGTLQGRITVAGTDVGGSRARDLAHLVGWVGQDPQAGFVTDTVEEEIAYGMEQLGTPEDVMRKRVEETLDLMGIAELRNRHLATLSGGQQQRVAIAAVLAAQPQVLVLDEPTSALDPTAAQDVLAAVTALVHDVGMTVVMAEHRLERVMHAADSILWLPGDGSAVHGNPGTVLARASVRPPLVQLAAAMGWSHVPMSVRDARRRLHDDSPPHIAPLPERELAAETAVSVDGVCHSYGPVRALAGVDAEFPRGSITAVMGRNGSGKSTLLWAIQGDVRAAGRISVDDVQPAALKPRQARRHVGMVPQEAADLLYLDTVAEECRASDRQADAAPGTTAAVLDDLGVPLDPERHPRDLSEGQRLALVLAIQLAASPSVLLLDEPTRGLDYAAKDHLAALLRALSAGGTTVVISTHDIEFAAAVSDRTLVLAQGEVVSHDSTRRVCTSTRTFAPQLARVFAPAPVLDVRDLRAVAR